MFYFPASSVVSVLMWIILSFSQTIYPLYVQISLSPYVIWYTPQCYLIYPLPFSYPTLIAPPPLTPYVMSPLLFSHKSTHGANILHVMIHEDLYPRPHEKLPNTPYFQTVPIQLLCYPPDFFVSTSCKYFPFSGCFQWINPGVQTII